MEFIAVILILAFGIFTYLTFQPSAKPIKRPQQQTKKTNNSNDHFFKKIPDGKYLVKYASEHSVEKGILIVLTITQGAFKKTKVPIIFDCNIAKRISNECKGHYISRLSFEGSKNQIIDKLYSMILEDKKSFKNEFMVDISNGFVKSVYKPNDKYIKRFKVRLLEDPKYNDNRYGLPPKE